MPASKKGEYKTGEESLVRQRVRYEQLGWLVMLEKLSKGATLTGKIKTGYKCRKKGTEMQLIGREFLNAYVLYN